MKTKQLVYGIIWSFLYVFLILTPILILLAGPKYSGRPPLLDLSVSLGFMGLAIMALQFVNSARLKFFNQPFGTDIVYHFHRQIGIAAFFMVAAHPLLLFILDARYLRLLNIFTAPWRAKFGLLAVLLLIAVVWTAEYRGKLKIPYGFWKIWHGILATLMVGLALTHIFTTGDYTDLPWKRILWIGYTILFLAMLAYTRVIYPFKLLRSPYQVEEVRKERGDVWTVAVKALNGKGLRFLPGQFAWLTAWKTPFSDSEHPFSIASSAESPQRIEMSIKSLGAYTAKIQTLKAGDRVYMDGPYGSFSSERYPDAKNLVFIPGGIGVTPIMSMLRTLAERGDRRPIKVLYANQTWESVTFREELEDLRKRLNMELVYVIERPEQNWKGDAGFINTGIIKKYIPAEWMPDKAEVFLCGPAPMMNAVEKALIAAGLAEKHIHTERFSLA